MPEPLYAQTIENMRRNLSLHRLTYLHSGSLFGVREVLDNLMATQSGQINSVRVLCIADDDFRRQLEVMVEDVEKATFSPTTLILAGVESLADQPSSYVSRKLGAARAMFMPLLALGHQLVIVSAIPRRRIRLVDRSNLLNDCHPVRTVPASLADIAAEAASIGGVDHCHNVFEKSAGFPQLARAYLTLSSHEMSNNARRRASALATHHVVGKAVVELGPHLAAWLEDKIMSTDSLELHVDEVPADVAEALRGAHFLKEADDGTVTLLPCPFRAIVIDELRRYCRETYDVSPTWSDLGNVLFRLERMLRNYLRPLLAEKIGVGWQMSLPEWAFAESYLSSECGGRVDKEAVDVLAYTSLDRLVELALKYESNRLWIQALHDVQREIGPIRNRFAHMRLMRAGDAATARSVYRRLGALVSLPLPVAEVRGVDTRDIVRAR